MLPYLFAALVGAGVVLLGLPALPTVGCYLIFAGWYGIVLGLGEDD
jgi:hypothetical protein